MSQAQLVMSATTHVSAYQHTHVYVRLVILVLTHVIECLHTLVTLSVTTFEALVINYTRSFEGNYARSFLGNYVGATISDSLTNVETYTLYVRVA